MPSRDELIDGMNDVLKLYEDGVGVDVFIARNIREVRKFCMDEYGWDSGECKDVTRFRKLKKEMWWMFRNTCELDGFVEKFGELKVGRFYGELAVSLTYEQAMQVYDGDVPGVISSTEY